MRRSISRTEFKEQIRSFEHTAFRLELQPQYLEPGEADWVQEFLAGRPHDPRDDAGFMGWYHYVTELTADGKRMERVRVQEDPPTDYQRWERWLGTWNVEAGEQMRYTTRQRAHEVGLLPAAGQTDWWLLDSCRLILMSFDEHGNRTGDELVTDPEMVVQACMWRDLAVHHSTLEEIQGAAA